MQNDRRKYVEKSTIVALGLHEAPRSMATISLKRFMCINIYTPAMSISKAMLPKTFRAWRKYETVPAVNSEALIDAALLNCEIEYDGTMCEDNTKALLQLYSDSDEELGKILTRDVNFKSDAPQNSSRHCRPFP
uniref:Uncharacterized protein n=1 Tax=Steinernema glaseri TaxID=37863 RepID=A0A1I7XYX2_9BILA